METQNMQSVIDSAKSKGFITLESESIEHNYQMALEFEKLSPTQQRELAAMSRSL